MLKLHLGCGPHIKEGWENYDLEPGPGGIKWDLRKPLPVDDNSVDFIFTEHFIEHLTRPEAVKFLQECFRALKPGGTLRISTPDLEYIMDQYFSGLNGNRAMIPWEVWKPLNPCNMVNEALRSWGHQHVFDRQDLTYALIQAGFPQGLSDIKLKAWQESGVPELCGLEVRPYFGDLILEARK